MKHTKFEPILVFSRDFFIAAAQKLGFSLCYDKFMGAKLILAQPIGEIYEK